MRRCVGTPGGSLSAKIPPVPQFLPLTEAISSLVHSGDAVALEGFTHLIPFAAGHEIIRQQLTGLTLVRMTPDLLYDQMIGCGCARKLVFSWGGNPGVGSLHRLRDAVEHGWPGPLEIEEHSHSAMAHAYAAGAAGMPCAIFRGYRGSELARVNPRIRTIACPFTGEELAAVPALRPDVTIVHAQRAGGGHGHHFGRRVGHARPPAAASPVITSASIHRRNLSRSRAIASHAV